MKTYVHHVSKCAIGDKSSFMRRDDHRCEQSVLGALCFLRESEIEPLGSCEFQPNRDMGIVTFVTHGVLEHKDDEGSRGVSSAGQIHYITAGKNLRLLEHNPSPAEKTKLLQLWIIPRQKALMPRFEQRNCDMDRLNRWALITSGNGRKNSLRIDQDVSIRVSHLFMGHTLVSDPLKSGYGRLLFVLDGEINACGHTLRGHDELHIIGDEPFEITANRDAHLFLIDVPMSDFE